MGAKKKQKLVPLPEEKKEPQAKEGDIRVWHIPQIPGKAFRVPVKDVEQAILVLDALAHYDLFQLEHRIKPDYANAQGLEVFEGGEWCEWYSADGDDIGDLRRKGE